MSSGIFWSVCGIALSIALAFAVSADDKKADPPKLTPEEVEAVAKINKTLDRKVVLDHLGTPLDQVCRELEKIFRVKIVLDPEELKKAGIAKDVSIKAQEKLIPLRDALKKILEPLGLTFEVRPEGVIIKAKEPPAE